MKMGALFGLAGVVIMLAVVGAALIFGGDRERRAAVIAGLGWTGSLAVQILGHRLDPNLAFAMIDAFALLGLLGLVWKPGQGWPLAAVLSQGLAVAIDCVRLISPHMHRWAYLTGLAVAGYGLLAAIAWGTVNAVRARRRATA